MNILPVLENRFKNVFWAPKFLFLRKMGVEGDCDPQEGFLMNLFVGVMFVTFLDLSFKLNLGVPDAATDEITNFCKSEFL